MSIRNTEHARHVLAHLGSQLRECDGCGKRFARCDMHAVGAGLLLVCDVCKAPPVFEVPGGDDGDDESDDGHYNGPDFER